MAIQLYTPQNKELSRVKLIEMAIDYGSKAKDLLQEVYGQFPELAQRRQRDEAAKVIRAINDILGTSGNFRNGCLYRESDLSERSKRGQVLDHAVPVIELVNMQLDGTALGYVRAALHPVVRIAKSTDERLNGARRTISGTKKGYPLFRYEGLGIDIVTHEGEKVGDLAAWTDDDHWALVKKTANQTPELKEIIEHFKIKLGDD